MFIKYEYMLVLCFNSWHSVFRIYIALLLTSITVRFVLSSGVSLLVSLLPE